MDDLISRLSELRCQYNCFDENERDAYHTLSEAIKALSDVPDTNVGDMISRQAAIDAILHNQEVYSNNFGNDPIDKYTIAIIDNDAQTIAQLPSAQPTLYGYKIEYLAYIARVMEKAGITAEQAVNAFDDLGLAVSLIIDEARQKMEETIYDHNTGTF